ncbi:MAG: Kelch repeat-containing protein [Gemmatimonadales bacterium]
MRWNFVSLTGLLLAAACTDEQSPTGPGGGGVPAPASPLALASNTWTELGPHPFDAVGGLSAGVFTNSANKSFVFTFGGLNDEGGTGWRIGRYNTATDVWRLEMPEVFVYQTNGVGTIGGKLYFSGGYLGKDGGVEETSRAVWAWDPVARSLIRRADMPKASAEGITGVIGDKLYVLPGVCGGDRWPQPGYCEEEPIRRLYRYNPAQNRWVGLRAAPHFHRSGAGGFIGGKFYVVGGFNGSQPVADLDRYDPATNTWKTLAPIPTPGGAIGTTLQGKLYVIAGSNAYVYDPGMNRWTAIAAPAWSHEALVRVVIDGKPRLLAVGGLHGAFPGTANVSELYTP